MRNFKSFLVEDQIDDVKVFVNYNLNEQATAADLRWLADEIKKETGITLSSIKNNGINYCDISFPVDKPITEKDMVNECVEIYKVIHESYKAATQVAGRYIGTKGIPKNSIDVNDVSMDCSKIDSLSGIHKTIDCVELELLRAINIQQNVLGLMLMKKLQGIRVSSNLLMWPMIIQKHLKGDRDLIDCKEELMKEGLKEYAKL